MKAKHLICLCTIAGLSHQLTASAQSTMPSEQIPSRSVNLELLGPYLLGGVSYDMRFSPNSPWGFRAGVGFGFSKASGLFGTSNSTAYSIPLEVNYLFGKKRGKLELGLGVNLGLYHDKYEVLSSLLAQNTIKGAADHFDAFTFANVGYRHVSKRGFQFRCGITTALGLTNNRGNGGSINFAPYVSFGKAF